MAYELFWGDLHSHCSISCGQGSAEQALLRACQQLDFASVTGHAFWPDMPGERSQYADVIDDSQAGFRRLAANWKRLLALNDRLSRPGRFLAFPSYEWQSLEFGDHNVYALDNRLPLRGADSVSELRAVAAERNGFVIPHHIGYAAGYRGIDWESFAENASPFVEVYSVHGCSLSESAPFPLLDSMGPRDFGSTAEAGWQKGFRFGIVGGSDHQGAYPGSHGDGRMGVFAESMTRESLWEAMKSRRVYAATGDRIDARLWIDDAWVGSEIENAGKRSIRIQVRGCDALDKVTLFKNGRVIGRFFPASTIPDASRNRYRLRITWGWGRLAELVDWDSEIRLSGGRIRKLESCFSGEAVVEPRTSDKETCDDLDLPHEVLEHSQRLIVWRSRTRGNPTPRHAGTQSLSLEIEAPLDASIDATINGQRHRHTLASLLRAGRSHYLRGLFSEAIRFGPLVPIEECQLSANVIDMAEEEVDLYRLEVSQLNGQWAWLSPIWVRR